MKVIILCAGYATRMYPLTRDVSKMLLPLAGKPLLSHIVERVRQLPGIDEILVVSNERFLQQFNQWNAEHKTTVLSDGSTSEENRLGALGDLVFATKNLDDDILLIAGDNYFEFDLRKMAAFYAAKQSAVIALRDLGNPTLLAGRFGVAELDHDRRVTGFEEKPAQPKTSLASAALYFLPKQALSDLREYMSSQAHRDNLGSFITWLAQKRAVYGFVFNEAWHDVGNIEEYHALDAKLSSAPKRL